MGYFLVWIRGFWNKSIGNFIVVWMVELELLIYGWEYIMI